MPGMASGGQLQEDLFQTQTYGVQFIQLPATLDDGARQLGANVAAGQTLYREERAAFLRVPAQNAADAGHLFQALLSGPDPVVAAAVARQYLHGDRLRATQAAGQVLHRIGGDQFAFGDDDDALADGFDLGQDVRRKNDGVVARQTLDQVPGFDDLVGIETGGR